MKKRTKRAREKRSTKPKKEVLEEEVKEIIEEKKEIIKEAEEKIQEEPSVPKEEVAYTLKNQEKPAQEYTPAKPEAYEAKKPAFAGRFTAEKGYIEPAAVKAGLPRKGFIESKGLLKDAMLEELKKKQEEETKKEYEERRKKMYGSKEEEEDQ